MRDILLTLIIFGSIPIIFVRPFIGVLMWAWVGYMVPHSLTWGFAYSYPFAQVVAIVTLLAWVISKEPKMPHWNTGTVLLLMLTLWISITTLPAIVPDQAYLKWEKTIKVLFMTFVTMAMLTNRKRIEYLIWVIVLSIGFYGTKGGVYLLLGGSGRVWGPSRGFFEDNNALGLTLLMIIPLFRYLQLQSKALWMKIGLGAAMLLCSLGVVGTYSRGAMLGGVAMLLALAMWSPRRLLLITLIVVGAFATAPFVPDRWVDRMETIKDYENDGSAMSRIRAWRFAWELALERPIFGGGFGASLSDDDFLRLVPDATGSSNYHSIYFEVLGDHGFVGLVIFLALGCATFLCAYSTIRLAKNNEELQWASNLSKMVCVAIVGYAISGVFLNLAFFDLYYSLIAIVICTSAVANREALQAPQVEGTARQTLALER